MDRQPAARRLLLVHAHPDDESIGTGATIARYAADGAQVTLVTCTLGELGEVIPPELAYLAGTGDRLGAHRMTELAAACAALGVRDQRFLGGPGRWRDSGMMGLPDNDSPDCFWQADVGAAAAELARIVREVRPQVLVSYDANGFYGHPDHIQAHRVAAEAIHLATRPGPGQGAGNDGIRPWQVAKFYATAMPRSVAAADGLPYWVPDDQVTTEIDGTAYLPAKTAALRAHATQVAVKGERGGGRGVGGRSPWPTGAGSRCGHASTTPCWPAPPARTPGPWRMTCSPGWTGGDPLGDAPGHEASV